MDHLTLDPDQTAPMGLLCCVYIVYSVSNLDLHHLSKRFLNNLSDDNLQNSILAVCAKLVSYI